MLTMPKPTKDQRKAIKSAQNAYAMAKAWNEKNLEIDQKAGKEVLKEGFFPYAEKWSKYHKGRVLDPTHDYLMDDSVFYEYLQKKHEKAQGMGLKRARLPNVKPWNVTADAESRPILRAAEDVLIETGLNIIPEPMKSQLQGARDHWEHRKSLIDIIMRWNPDK